MAHNRRVGRTAGLTEAQLEVLAGDDYLSSPLFDDRAKAVIRWAELVTWNQAKDDNAAFAELRRHFDDAATVELTVVAAYRNFMNRFMDSLQIELEPLELQVRGGKAAATREALQAYIHQMAEWA